MCITHFFENISFLTDLRVLRLTGRLVLRVVLRFVTFRLVSARLTLRGVAFLALRPLGFADRLRPCTRDCALRSAWFVGDTQ